MTESEDSNQVRNDMPDGWPRDPAIQKSLKAFQEADLHAFVEGELDGSQQQALLAKLADHPALMQLLESLQADRRLLKSCKSSPMPIGMEIDVQAALARPMLVDSQVSVPGAYRRKINKQAQRARFLRLITALAAAIIIVAGAVIFLIAISPGLSEPKGSQSPLLATGNNDGLLPPEAAAPLLAEIEAVRTPETRAVDSSISERSVKEAWRLNAESIPFALVLSASTETQAMELLLRARRRLAAEDGMVTVVRNFSRIEAAQLEQDLLAVDDPSRVGPMPGTLAAIDMSDGPVRWFDGGHRNWVSDQDFVAQSSKTDQSGVISGPSNLAPDYDIQLSYSDRGATYTIAIRLCEVDSLLQELALVEPAKTRLVAISDEAPQGRLEQMAWIRKCMNQLQHASDQMIIYLPVVVKIPDAGR